METTGSLFSATKLRTIIMKLKKLSFILIGLNLSTQGLAQDLSASCKKALLAELDICPKIQKLEDFSVQKKSYSVAYVECSEDENETAQYVLLEQIDKTKCEVRDYDTSFIDYMFGVAADLKSKAPVEAFEAAIKAELRHQLKNKDEQRSRVESLRKRNAVGDLTRDQKWVLNYLEGELKK